MLTTANKAPAEAQKERHDFGIMMIKSHKSTFSRASIFLTTIKGSHAYGILCNFMADDIYRPRHRCYRSIAHHTPITSHIPNTPRLLSNRVEKD